MPFNGPYPTVFSGNTAAMVISHTTFSSGVTNTGTIGAGGITVVSGAFLSGGGILDIGTVVGGIKVDSSSRIVASGATQNAIAVENTPARSAAASAMPASFRLPPMPFSSTAYRHSPAA